MALVLSALVGLTATGARAETISMTITLGNGATFPVDSVATIDPSGQGYTVDAAGLTAINLFLAGQHSDYRFGNGSTIAPSTTSLGGSSNFAGSSQANLVLTGEIHNVGGGSGTNPGILTITETESLFTSPTGSAGTLTSSSSGNFTNQPAGAGHTAFSDFNTTNTPTYHVYSTGTGVNSGTTNGPVSMGLTSVPTLFTLSNSITFNLAAGTVLNNVVDSFGVTAVVTAVPEPASLVMLLTGMPVPLAIVGWLRRRKATQGWMLVPHMLLELN
jgi:hypothetical protein